jgi:hypothetical protein
MDKFELFLKKDIKEGSILYTPVSSIAPILFPEFRKVELTKKQDEKSANEIKVKNHY